jgi:hypothetical protein
MMGVRNRDSWRKYFKRLKILPLQSQYSLSLLLFVAENIDYFRFNLEIHGFNTKNKSSLHLPPSKLIVFQRGPYYSGIKAFNNLPNYVKNLLQTKKQFKWALKEFLHLYSFYSLNEFYNYNRLQNFFLLTMSYYFFCHIINVLETTYISDCYFNLLSFKVHMY